MGWVIVFYESRFLVFNISFWEKIVISAEGGGSEEGGVGSGRIRGRR